MGEIRTVLVTGGARGIGLAVGKWFLQRGWQVGLYDIDEEALRKAREEIAHAHVITGRLDVTDADSVAAALSDFGQRTGGRLDVLVNNAGMVRVGEFEDIPAEEYQNMVALNVTGMILMTHQALPMLKETPGSRIITMSSASAIYGNPELTVYAATKSAVRSLTEGWRMGFAKYGIHVAAVLRIYVRTRMVYDYVDQYQGLDLKAVTLTADDVAQVVGKAATGRKRTVWLVGTKTKLLFALKPFMPDGLVRWLTRRELKYT